MISLYKLIWRNSIESCMSQANYENQVIEINSPNKDIGYYGSDVAAPVFKRIAEKISSRFPTIEKHNYEQIIEKIKISKKQNKSNPKNKLDS